MDLELYVLSELDEASRRHVEAHIRDCQSCARNVVEMTENLRLAPALRRDTPDRDALEQMPDSIGGYRILRKLGQGGMGAVYEAQQENPRRVVALKMLRPGLVSNALLARFRHEAQVLGRLRHPGIAQIYEAGTHRPVDGAAQPYFVMELVHGPALIEYAESKKLDVRRRLELIAKVCDAVQHAHQQGVIHRDLKPDNVLVDDSGGDAQPKILDFGVARVVDPHGQTTTLHTSVGQIVGTVAYMSPEQAGADPSAVDTRSDVYALGVLCYQLLSGRLPHKVNPLSIAESVRAIVQDEAAPLSTVNRSLRGDVTTIVGKALDKERSRRYQSAAEMASDVRRYLRDEPITAHPPSTIYQLRKFARRNKGLVAGVVAALVLLVVAVVGTTVGMLRARSEAAKALAVNNFLTEMLASADPRARTATDRAKGRTVTLFDALNAAASKVQTGSLRDQPEVEAAIRSTIASTYGSLGEYVAAEPHLLRALELHRLIHGSGGAHPDVARDLHLLAVNRHVRGQLDEAEQVYNQALSMRRQLFGRQHADIADTLESLGMLARERGRIDEAERLLSESLEMIRSVHGPEHPAVARTMDNLATVYHESRRFEQAENLYRDALVMRRKLLGDEHPDVATSLNEIAALLYAQAKYDDAEALFRQALEMRRKLLGDRHYAVAISLNGLATLLVAKERPADAEPLYREALEIWRRELGDDHFKVSLATSNFAMLLRQQGKLEEAEGLLRQVVAARRRMAADREADLPQALNNLAGVLRDQRKLAEAETLFRESIETGRAQMGDDHPTVALSRLNLAATVRDLGRPAEAEPLYRAALVVFVPAFGEAHLYTNSARAGIGGCLCDLNRHAEAEPELLRAYEQFRSTLGPTHARTIAVANRLVSVYEALGAPDRAEAFRAVLAATRPSTGQRE
jgi:tetratricopeptide (TPR) repeat protein